MLLGSRCSVGAIIHSLHSLAYTHFRITSLILCPLSRTLSFLWLDCSHTQLHKGLWTIVYNVLHYSISYTTCIVIVSRSTTTTSSTTCNNISLGENLLQLSSISNWYKCSDNLLVEVCEMQWQLFWITKHFTYKYGLSNLLYKNWQTFL